MLLLIQMKKTIQLKMIMYGLEHGLTYSHSKGALRFNYHFNYVEREYQDDSIIKSPFLTYSESRYIGRTHFAELYNNWKWENWELLAGMDYRFNNTDQYSFFFPGVSCSSYTLEGKNETIQSLCFCSV